MSKEVRISIGGSVSSSDGSQEQIVGTVLDTHYAIREEMEAARIKYLTDLNAGKLGAISSDLVQPAQADSMIQAIVAQNLAPAGDTSQYDKFVPFDETQFSEPTLPEVKRDGKQAVQYDSYDLEAYEEAEQSYEMLGKAKRKQAGLLATADELMLDVFNAFNKGHPMLEEDGRMQESHRLNRGLVEQMMQTKEYAEMHANTAGDDFASVIATVGTAESLVKSIPAEDKKRIADLGRLEKEIENLLDDKETYEDLAIDAQDKGDEARAEAMQNKSDQAGKEAEAAQKQFDKAAKKQEGRMEKIENAARQAVRVAIADAQAEIDEMNEAQKAYGGGFDPSVSYSGPKKVTAEQKIAMAGRLKASPKLKDIASILGRFTRIAIQTQKNKSQHPPEEVIGVKTGNDISHLVMSEMALLADDDLEDLFFQKYADKKLLQYELDKTENQGKGPIVVALDSSGSMQAPANNGLTREVWSKGVAIAMMTIARKQKRDIAIIHFSSNAQVQSFVFPKGQSKVSDVMDCAEFFFGSGTDYKGWMDEAMKLVDGSKFDRADVLIVSDGDVRISDELARQWQKRRDERQMRCHSILIGETWHQAALAQVSDSVVALTDLSAKSGNEEKAFDAAFSI